MNDGDRRTPPDSLVAMQAAVLRTEQHAKDGANYAAMVWQEVKRSNNRLEAVEADLDFIKRAGFRYPLAVALLALALSVAAFASSSAHALTH